MKSKWYTNMVQLSEQNITHDDILMVRLTTIIKDANKLITENKICPARIKMLDEEIEWEIDDGVGDFLYIRMPKGEYELGYTYFEENETNVDYVYVITACQIIIDSQYLKKYVVNIDNVPMCYTEHRDEARNIAMALRNNKINAIVKQYKPPALEKTNQFGA